MTTRISTQTHTYTLTSRRSYRKIEWVCVCVVTGQYARQRRLPMTTPNYIVGMTECNYLRLNLDMLCSHSHLILLMLRCCIISKRVYRIHAIHDEAISAYVIKNEIHLAVFCVGAMGPSDRYSSFHTFTYKQLHLTLLVFSSIFGQILRQLNTLCVVLLLFLIDQYSMLCIVYCCQLNAVDCRWCERNRNFAPKAEMQ